MDRGQVFISEGYVFLPNMPMSIHSGELNLFPFLKVEINNWYGESNISTSLFIKIYKAKLYAIFPQETAGQTQDIGNRTQTEPYIRKALEVYLLAHSIFYGEATQFQFRNTMPISAQEVPSDIVPLNINIELGGYDRLFSHQTRIRSGGRVSNAQLPTGSGLGRAEDLSNQRFTLVKPMGSGAIIRGMPDDRQRIINEHQLVELYAQAIRRLRNDRIIINPWTF